MVPENVEILATEQPDPCHHDIFGFPSSGKASGKVIKAAWDSRPETFFECCASGDAGMLDRAKLCEEQVESEKTAS